MARAKFQTLTAQMYYVLLCLTSECYGMDIMDQVSTMTNGTIKVGSGTLYHLLEQFSADGIIRETKVEGRRRSYIITDKGLDMLTAEYQRIRSQVADYEKFVLKEEKQ